MSETRTVQEIARAQATATMIEPEHSIMLAMSNRIDTLEKALRGWLALQVPFATNFEMSRVEAHAFNKKLSAAHEAALSALHPSDHIDAQAGGVGIK